MKIFTALGICLLMAVLNPVNGQNTDSLKIQQSRAKTLEVLKKIIETTTHNKENSTDSLLENQNDVDGFIIVDETRTKSGRDFYECFQNKWDTPPNIHDYTITIQELPYRLTTTQINILVNDNIAYRSILQSRYEIIENQVEEAVSYCMAILTNYEEVFRDLNTPDMDNSKKP
ncbi:MAG: CsgE family curli-type amyloid fiber assembly protein [Bacteroidota bacterium]|nr:CsgE family curli-type amyloid fiber assembly protein [Bacteroidota bacterium]MDP4206596.1 CsgE family curli-type amyloid fiber assembly protein [Bacteroidota bacterium]